MLFLAMYRSRNQSHNTQIIRLQHIYIYIRIILAALSLEYVTQRLRLHIFIYIYITIVVLNGTRLNKIIVIVSH